MERTGEIKAFKLLSVAGSYFRGHRDQPDAAAPLRHRRPSPQEELDAHLEQLEEAKQRDHRKLGKELDLFSIQEDVGPGPDPLASKGARIRSIIEDFWRQRALRRTATSSSTRRTSGAARLWETSGHLGFYRENMYAPMEIDGHEYFVKPMNCPFHIQIYKTHKRSYRDLPLRWAELGTVYRYEKSGVLHGLLRVRGFTQDDAHIFCTPEQIEDEVDATRALRARHAARPSASRDITAYLSTRPEKAVGEDGALGAGHGVAGGGAARPRASRTRWTRAAARSTGRRST